MSIKKALAIALALMMALALLACGGSQNVIAADPTPEPTATPEAAPEETAEPEPTDTPAPTEAPLEELLIGVVEEDQYTNRALGISFTLPSGWAFGAAEDLGLSTQLAADVMYEPEAIKAALQGETFFLDVRATNKTMPYRNLSVRYEYLDPVETEHGALVSEESYAGLAEARWKETVAKTEALTGTVIELGTHMLGDQTFVTLTVDAAQTRARVSYRMYYKKHRSDFMIDLTLMGANVGEIDSIASRFIAIP